MICKPFGIFSGKYIEIIFFARLRLCLFGDSFHHSQFKPKKGMNMRIIFTLPISIFLLALSACTSISPTPRPSPQETRIGVLLPLSGERAFSGRKTLAGIFLAHDQLENKGQVRGKMIKLVIIDNKSTVKGSREAMKTFIDKENITLLIAACSTANALAIKPLAEDAKIPVLLTIATGNIVTERSPYMFRCCFTDSLQGKAMAVFACRNKLYDNVSVLLDLNDRITYRRDLGRAFAAAFKKISGKTVTEVGYCSGSDNFVPQIAEFKKNRAAAIFAPSDIPDAGIILRQARKCGVDKVFLGSDGWDHPELFKYSGPQPQPCFFTSMFSPEADLPGVKEFVRAIKARTGSAPNVDTAQAYDALRIAVNALKLSRTPDDIRSGLYQIQNFPGVTGAVSINAQGDAVKAIFIKEVIQKPNGKFGFKLIKTILPQEREMQ